MDALKEYLTQPLRQHIEYLFVYWLFFTPSELPSTIRKVMGHYNKNEVIQTLTKDNTVNCVSRIYLFSFYQQVLHF